MQERHAGLASQKYANKPPGLPSQRNEKMHRSEFLRKFQKLAGWRSRKLLKSPRSRVTENAKKSQVRGQRKM